MAGFLRSRRCALAHALAGVPRGRGRQFNVYAHAPRAQRSVGYRVFVSFEETAQFLSKEYAIVLFIPEGFVRLHQ